MIVKKSTPWGIISGKLSLKPEQAKEMFGFDMDAEAIGVVLRRRNGKLVICNQFPLTFKPVLTAHKRNFRSVMKVAQLILPFIRKSWAYLPEIKNLSAINIFIKENVRRLDKTKYLDFRKYTSLVLTKGMLTPPRLRRFSDNTIELYNYRPSYEIGIIVLEANKFVFHIIEPRRLQTNAFRLEISKFSPPMVIYFYYKEGNKYSDSVARIILQ